MKRAILFIMFVILFSVLGHGQVRSECADPNVPCTPLWWDSNTEPNVDRYRVYRSDVTCADPAPEPSTCPTFVQVGADVPQGPSLSTPRIVDEPLNFNQTYFYRATALNTSDLESMFSDELSVTWGAVRPSPPGNFRGTETGAHLRLRWNENPPEEQVNAYTVRKASSRQGPGGIIAHVSMTYYRDINPGRRGPKFYWVTAVNDAELESDPSGPVVYRGRR